MRNVHNNNGFSLTEVLLAVGTLAIGMIFIGGTFLAGIHFSTIATERTIAAIAADEAFAKIKLCGVEPDDLATDQQTPFVDIDPIDPNELAYPSTETDLAEKQYFWSALCRRVAPDPNRLVQITVFVSRKVGSNPIPLPEQVSVSEGTLGNDTLRIETGREDWINDGYTIVDDSTGGIYRVQKRYPDSPDTIELDRSWQGGDSVWVVPPAGGGRYPCIAVYQTAVRF